MCMRLGLIVQEYQNYQAISQMSNHSHQQSRKQHQINNNIPGTQQLLPDKQTTQPVNLQQSRRSEKAPTGSISQRQWEAVYNNAGFVIDVPAKEQNPYHKKQNRSQRGENNIKASSQSKHLGLQERQEMLWETAYIDDKFYLIDPTNMQKLRQLDREIQAEKDRLVNIETGEPIDQSYLSHKNYNEQSFDQNQNMKMESLTQIDQSRLVERKRLAEADLLQEEQKYRSKIEDMKKRKTMLKKEISCGANDKNLQANEAQIVEEQLHQQSKEVSKPGASKIASPKERKSSKLQNQLAADPKSKKESSVKKHEEKDIIGSAKKEIKEGKEAKVMEKSGVAAPIADSSAKERSVKQKEKSSKKQKQSEDRKSQKSAQPKGNSSNNIQLNLPKLPQNGKSYKPSAIGMNEPINVNKPQADKKSLQNSPSANKGDKKTEKSEKAIEKIEKSEKQTSKQNEKSQEISIKAIEKSEKSKLKLEDKQSKKAESHRKVNSNQIKNEQTSSKDQQPQSNKMEDNKSQIKSARTKKSHKAQIQVSASASAEQQNMKSNASVDRSQQKQKSAESRKDSTHMQKNLIPQIQINSNSFKKTDKSVQWEEVDPSVSRFSVDKTELSKAGLPVPQPIEERSHVSKKSNDLMERSVTDKLSKKSQSIRQAQTEKNMNRAESDISRSKVKQAITSSDKKSNISQSNQHSASASAQAHEDNEPQSASNHYYNQQSESSRKSQSDRYQKSSSRYEEAPQSQQKKASFKIHSRDSSVRSRKSKSIAESQKDQQRTSQIGSINRMINHSSNSELNQSQLRNHQEQINKLHENISQLQEKLRKVQEKQNKQEQMIKFENNQSKIVNDLGTSNVGSEPASPLTKLGLTSKLKLQTKLTLEPSTVQFNTFEEKLKMTAQDNEKLEKLMLQQEIGRLKKVIRNMQMQKIMSIQYDQNNTFSKVERRPSLLDAQNSRISEKMKDSLNSDILETRKIDDVNQTFNDAGKIKRNSLFKQYQIDSPRKYNRLNAEKSKQFSEVGVGSDEAKEQPPPLRKKAESMHGSSVRNRKEGLMNKFDENEKNFHQFLEASRLLVKEPETIAEPVRFSMPEYNQEPNHITHSFQTKKNPQNISQMMQKLKNENPEDELTVPSQIPISSIQIPNLPECPNISMSQDDLQVLAKITYGLFGIDVDADPNQLCMKKYKNCVVFTFGSGYQQTILWHYSGKFYFGGWRNTSDPGEGEKIGEGLQYIPGKHVYKGQFLGGKKNGNGILKAHNGNIYDGQWVDGVKSGRGVYFQESTGIYYSGEWRDGKRDGYGILKFSNSEFYEGTFSKSVKQGYGMERFANGDYYKGEYQKGKFNGKGKYCWANGSSYEGNFVDGLRQGQGNWKSARKGGDIYIGEYENDKKCGYGRYLWGNGCVYQGYFRNDLKNGKGRLVYEDGKEIKGSWQDGQLVTTDSQTRRPHGQQDQPLRRSIRASSLKSGHHYHQQSSRGILNHL